MYIILMIIQDKNLNRFNLNKTVYEFEISFS